MLSQKSVKARSYESPPFVNMLCELTALIELPSFFAFQKILSHRRPKGDGHPVYVLPGFMAGDRSTAAMRKLLAAQGFDPYPWGLGTNPGLCEDISQKVEAKALELASQTGKKVSLIGWSAGGMYARLAAHRHPEAIRQVITLGSPFGVDYSAKIENFIGKLYHRSKQNLNADPIIESGLVVKAPPVPSTSIISKRDGIAFWKFSLDISDDHTENIMPPGSHGGMTHNLLYMDLIIDRLIQPEGNWKPFSPTSRLHKALIKLTCATEEIPQWIAHH